MNFKQFGRTANLFDENNLEGGIYLAANGNKYGSIADGVRSSVKIDVLPNTTYTLSAYSEANIALRILEWADGVFATQTPKYNISGNVSLTITTTNTTDKLAFNLEGANGQYADNIMLNEGSTALPYQPYKDWTEIPYYQHKTATDTLTLPAVIYPNDTSITVGIKGQSSQSGTGTTSYPSKSVTVQSLESGTNYAKFNLADFPDVAVNDKITVNVGGTNYSLAVKKIDSSYVYVENKEV